MNKEKQVVEIRFDAIKFMREQRDILSDKLSNMSKTEIIEYFKRKKRHH